MKTAISIPDETFEAAETLAGRLGLSRSELYATAVAEYLARHRTAGCARASRRGIRDSARGFEARGRHGAGAGGFRARGRLVMRRGEIRFAARNRRGDRQPVLVIQEDEFNRSLIQTVLCAVISGQSQACARSRKRFPQQKGDRAEQGCGGQRRTAGDGASQVPVGSGGRYRRTVVAGGG